MKKILISALLMAGVAFGADAVTYAYDVASNYTGTYALSSPADFTVGNKSVSSNYNKNGKWYETNQDFRKLSRRSQGIY